MNKTVLKTFATSARRELLEKVQAKARKIGITEDKITKANVESSDAIFIDGRQLSKQEKIQREKLIERIKEKGYTQVMEESAYTWFNRFTALRFMEVNEYLPSKVRVLSSSTPGDPVPDIIKEAMSLDFEVDKKTVYEWKLKNENESLFQYLMIKQCNVLNAYLPFMFEKIDDFAEILFPEGVLSKGSFLRQMTNTNDIPEEDWTQVEIIGWLYQYYISEKKEKVFSDLKKNIKINKETLPAATQLFTPNWIARYLVENSLGRLWLESYPKSILKEKWKYYLEPPAQDSDVEKQLDNIRYEHGNPEKITFLDPSCGSGHILIYAFEVFYNMYLEKGYLQREIPKLILKNNLFGLDVDERAVQLASFAMMMKAREKSRRIFSEDIYPNIISIQESNWLSNKNINLFSGNNLQVKKALETLKSNFIDAKEYGSLITPEKLNVESLIERLEEFKVEYTGLFESVDKVNLEKNIPILIRQYRFLRKTYDVICTNPPYVATSGMNDNLKFFLNRNFNISKKDTYSAFMERTSTLVKENRYVAMITMEGWMFLSSFEKFREYILKENALLNLIHMPYEGRGRTSLGINFGTTAFIYQNLAIKNYNARFMCIRFNEIDANGVPKRFPTINDRFKTKILNDFLKLPGRPIAYWVDERIVNLFQYPKLKEFCDVQEGLKTGYNEKFIKKWYEINVQNSNIVNDNRKVKWVKHTKGGAFQKWYGNNEEVLYFANNGQELKNFQKSSLTGQNNYFKENITWSRITSSKISFRYSPEGSIPNMAGLALYPKDQFLLVIGWLNTYLVREILNAVNPTLNFPPGTIGLLPIKKKMSEEVEGHIKQLVKECIYLSKNDWDKYEISWDFKTHPMLETSFQTINSAVKAVVENKKNAREKLYQNEIKLNQIFLSELDLEDTGLDKLNKEDITLKETNNRSEISSFMSYAVGCIFGRYSIDEKGLIYAGGEFNPSIYQSFEVDKDNILPIVEGAHFKDDIVFYFIEFVRVTFGDKTLNENLIFIADILGKKENESIKETIRRYFLDNFFKDHVQTYKKRPIYWLFTSGKRKAFNCLVYMHRYDPSLLSRIRTDYLHELQTRMDVERESLASIIDGDSNSNEINKAKKDLQTLDKKIEELKEYDETLHQMADQQIEIDLDDGVEVNYAKFKDLLAKK